jgi:hypothetical protein
LDVIIASELNSYLQKKKKKKKNAERKPAMFQQGTITIMNIIIESEA